MFNLFKRKPRQPSKYVVVERKLSIERSVHKYNIVHNTSNLNCDCDTKCDCELSYVQITECKLLDEVKTLPPQSYDVNFNTGRAYQTLHGNYLIHKPGDVSLCAPKIDNSISNGIMSIYDKKSCSCVFIPVHRIISIERVSSDKAPPQEVKVYTLIERVS